MESFRLFYPQKHLTDLFNYVYIQVLNRLTHYLNNLSIMRSTDFYIIYQDKYGSIIVRKTTPELRDGEAAFHMRIENDDNKSFYGSRIVQVATVL